MTGTREDNIQKIKEWKDLCREKEKRKKEEEETQLRNIKNEIKIWKYINKYKKKREKVANKIKKQEWRNYFRDLLNGKDVRELGEKRQNIERDEEVMEEEIRRAIRKVKKKKPAGSNNK